MAMKIRYFSGLQSYLPLWAEMKNFTEQRTPETPDELWLLEHHPVFTQGRAGKPEHVIAPGEIPVIATDRGGQITYHGPGQLVGYCLFDIRRKGWGPRRLVCSIEQVLLDYLQTQGVEGHRIAGAPGIYVGDAKIASLGLRIYRGCSYHGFSFNVHMDLEPFSRINPCGYAQLKLTQLGDWVEGPQPSPMGIAKDLATLFRSMSF